MPLQAKPVEGPPPNVYVHAVLTLGRGMSWALPRFFALPAYVRVRRVGRGKELTVFYSTKRLVQNGAYYCALANDFCRPGLSIYLTERLGDEGKSFYVEDGTVWIGEVSPIEALAVQAEE